MEDEKAGDDMRRSKEEQEPSSMMEEEKAGDDISRSMKEEQEPGSTLKFSFTASKSKFSKSKFSASRPPLFPKGKQRIDEGEEHRDVEFVTAVNENGIVAKDPKGLRGARVIPKLENSWRPEKRMKNIMMETDIMNSSTEDRFEKEETVVGGPNPGIQYGLTVGVRKVETTVQQVVTTVVEEQNGNTVYDRMEDGKEQTESLAQLEDERLRQDLTSRPDEADMDTYDEMPIEDFGEAILRGMGWEKGKPIGRNCKVAVVPVEYVKRSGRLGLGAEPAPKQVNTTRQIKPGQSRVAAPELVASVGTDGRVRNVVPLDEKLVERSRKGVVKGKVMSIISGRHLGLRGEVLDSEKPDRVSVKLVKSGEKVLVNIQDLADIGSLEEEKVLKQIRQLKIGNGEASRRDDRKDDNHDTEENSLHQNEENKHGRKEDRREGRREKDNWREERPEYGSKVEYRREDEERTSRSSRRDSRRDERGDHEDHKRSTGRDGRRQRKRDDHERANDDMEVDDEGRIRRAEDKRGPVRDQKREDRRNEVRRGENKRDGRREDERAQREQGRNLQERDERAGRDRRSTDGRLSDDRYEKERGDADAGNLDRDSSVAINEGRYKDAWLTSQIRVRIISKTLKGGRVYLKKARIVDVVTPKECDILLDESGEFLQHVKQDQLETALPKRGGRIMVVGGRQRGLLGRLIERDSGGVVGTVQMEESFEIITLDLDLLAEFVGDASERDD